MTKITLSGFKDIRALNTLSRNKFMVRTLLAFGDSHTAGAEIISHGNYECYEQAYPAYIAKYYGMNYENYSQAGCSNDWLLKLFYEKIEYSIKEKKEIFILFNFCEASRMYLNVPPSPKSLIEDDGVYYGPLHYYSSMLDTNFFGTVKKTSYIRSLLTYLPVYRYYLSLNSDDDLSKKGLNQMFTVQTICERYNIPFVFHNSIQWYHGDWSLINKRNHFGYHTCNKSQYDINTAYEMTEAFSYWGIARNHPDWKHYYQLERWRDHYPKEYHKYWASRLIQFIDQQKILNGYI